MVITINGKRIDIDDLYNWVSNIAEKVDHLEVRVDNIEARLNRQDKAGPAGKSYGYADAVKAIWDNFDSSFYASLVVGKLKHYSCAPEYYKSVIAIAEADGGSDYYKANTIEDLGNNF